jgi:hypothetical protein
MMNKKLVALLLAVSAISSLSAHCYRDGYCDGPVSRTVEGTGYVAGDVVDGTGEVASDVAAVPGDVVTGIFGGRERRQERREARRDRRAERRGYYRD